MLVPFNRTAWALRDEMHRLAETSLTCLLSRKKEVEEPEFPEPFRILSDLGYRSQVMTTALARIARIDAGQTIMVTVSAFSDHGSLVRALDLCAKNGLKSLSIVSASN